MASEEVSKSPLKKRTTVHPSQDATSKLLKVLDPLAVDYFQGRCDAPRSGVGDPCHYALLFPVTFLFLNYTLS